jgi:hypothetical protein
MKIRIFFYCDMKFDLSYMGGGGGDKDLSCLAERADNGT